MSSEELLSILVRLSRIDDYFDQFELGFLIKVGNHLGIQNELVEDLIKKPLDSQSSVPSSEQDRMNILYYMLFLMKIDTIITDSEKEMVHHYGFMLGFSKPMIDDFIKLMEEHKFRKVPTESMLNVIRRYQN